MVELAARRPRPPPGTTTAGVSLVELGEQVNAKVPGGANVHLLRRRRPTASSIRTYERGVGPTAACGTGACASAAAAQAWGLVGAVVAVRMPGGAAHVTLGDSVVLRGPAAYIATIDVPNPMAAGAGLRRKDHSPCH